MARTVTQVPSPPAVDASGWCREHGQWFCSECPDPSRCAHCHRPWQLIEDCAARIEGGRQCGRCAAHPSRPEPCWDAWPRVSGLTPVPDGPRAGRMPELGSALPREPLDVARARLSALKDAEDQT